MAAEQYDSASVLSDGVAGIPVLKIKHTRQTTMLALLKLTLDPSSESARIIKNCQHFSGFLVVTANEEAAGAVKGEPQALELLNARWADGTSVDEDPGALFRDLDALKWPMRLDLDVYNEYFNKLTSLLIRLDMLPSDESEASVRRRLQSWHRFAEPPQGSAYVEIARAARLRTLGAKQSVADRIAFHAAFVSELTMATVSSGSGRSKVLAASVGETAQQFGMSLSEAAELLAMEAAQRGQYEVGAEPGAFARTYAGLAASPASGAFPRDMPADTMSRECTRCPLGANGQKTKHPVKFRCEIEQECDTCGSSYHADHSCFIKLGITPVARAKMSSGVLTEIERLHKLYMAGQFDKLKTDTTLRWMQTMRRKLIAKAAGARATTAANLAMASDFSNEEFEAIEAMGLGHDTAILGATATLSSVGASAMGVRSVQVDSAQGISGQPAIENPPGELGGEAERWRRHAEDVERRNQAVLAQVASEREVLAVAQAKVQADAERLRLTDSRSCASNSDGWRRLS